jgi:hypothetical protein
VRLAAGRDWWFSYKKSVARPERFELPTTWFEARCSIQLSYGRMGTQCSREVNILKPRGREFRPLEAVSAYRLGRNAVWESSSLA